MQCKLCGCELKWGNKGRHPYYCETCKAEAERLRIRNAMRSLREREKREVVAELLGTLKLKPTKKRMDLVLAHYKVLRYNQKNNNHNKGE